ncbi:MAG TPA: tRNA isopentenyl-2-thiomethyl-A-37 hydroxylase MiaE [Steroidobacteraceae bacterium]|nr:tRNA isopentenyl-2-thiomethyl-A-37 hydroxylase MiaE [Steroidobacteraceae bacterium]
MATPAAPAGILNAATPVAWALRAARDWQQLLVDHANCEKKAASTALSLMFAYPEDTALCQALARLAREELRHFEQVQQMMARLGVPVRRLSPGRYAGGLRAALANSDPERKLDLLLCGALIEARSCERFEVLVPYLQPPMSVFYADLARSEKRHAGLYLDFAQATQRSAGLPEAHLEARLAALATLEAGLILSADREFRFHSGVPEEVAVA